MAAAPAGGGTTMRNEIPPEIMTPLCSAVGEFVVSWAVLEMGLDSCIAVIY
jgi:hypothetical protein